MRIFGWAGLALLFLCAGCGDGGTGPTKRAQIQFVSGNALSDTVDAPLNPALLVVVHDSTGAVVPSGTVVRFQTGLVIDTTSGQVPFFLPPTAFVESFTSNTFDLMATGTTDASGRTGVLVKLGMHAGPAAVVITVPTLGIVDTARFTVQPGAASTIAVTPADTTLATGKSYQLKGGVVDRYGNIRADAVTWSGTRIQVTTSGVVTTAGVGRYTIAVRAGSVTATGMVSVVPAGRIVAVNGPHIVTFDLDGSNVDTIVTAMAGATLGSPRWIPNTNTVVYTATPSGGSIELMRVDASSHVTGAGTPFLTPAVPDIINADEPAPSANGGWVYFGGHNTSCAEDVYCLYRVGASGSGATLFALAQAQGGTQFSPAPSPDGSRVAFVTDSTGYSVIRILDVAANTLEAPIILGVNPAWSPDGAHVVYLSSFDGTLLIMNPDGTNSRSVVPGGRMYSRQDITWSPDGQWVILDGGAPGSYPETGLELVQVQTGAVLPLAYAGAFQSASWK